MGYYQIGDYFLYFTFTDNHFIKERIAKFEIDQANHYDFKLTSEIKEEIIVPEGELIIKHQNKAMYKLPNGRFAVCFAKEGIVDVLAVHDEDYQNVELYFNKRLGDDIAEQEYILTGMVFNSMMASKSVICLHASAISHNNDGILFSASSGTGKSTHTNLWMKYKNDVLIVNDDKPLIRYKNNRFELVGSPWSGKTSKNENVVVPLKAICFLSQSKENKASELTDYEKLIYVIRNLHRPMDEKLYKNVLDIVNILVQEIPMYHLQCDISPTAVETIYNKIYKENEI